MLEVFDEPLTGWGFRFRVSPKGARAMERASKGRCLGIHIRAKRPGSRACDVKDWKHASRGTAEPDTHGMWKGREERRPPLPSSRRTLESGCEFSGWKGRGL